MPDDNLRLKHFTIDLVDLYEPIKHLQMEQLTKNSKLILTAVALSLINTLVLAQDSSSSSSSVTSSSTTVTTTETWYAQPWVWIVGAAILIIIIVALTRGNGGNDGTRGNGRVDKVTYTKKVSREDI